MIEFYHYAYQQCSLLLPIDQADLFLVQLCDIVEQGTNWHGHISTKVEWKSKSKLRVELKKCKDFGLMITYYQTYPFMEDDDLKVDPVFASHNIMI